MTDRRKEVQKEIRMYIRKEGSTGERIHRRIKEVHKEIRMYGAKEM